MSMLQELDSSACSSKTVEFDSSAPAAAPARLKDPRTIGLKRAVDIVGSVAALVFFAPLMSIIYLVLMVSGGEPVFAHRRVDQNGALFPCYKFRSMVKDADAVLARHLEQDPAARAEW